MWSIPKFFWSLDFTQKNVSYLPVPSGSPLNYEYRNFTYIRNPYSFTQNNITNYNWYIIVYHYNKTVFPYFSYEYTNKENEEDEEREEDEEKEESEENEERDNPNPNGNTKSFIQKPIFWVITILSIIIICALGIFIYLKKIKKSNLSEDNILKDKELYKSIVTINILI